MKIFTSATEWIKKNLRLHLPLWIIGSLALLAIFLIDSKAIANYLVGSLFLAYFLFRYLWRKHLAKQGQLGNASSGIFSLAFWGVAACLYIYTDFSPKEPELVVYASTPITNESAKKEKEKEKEKTDDDDEAKKSRKGSSKKGFIKHFSESVRLHAYVHDYMKQEKLMSSIKAFKTVELDGNANTLEVMAINHELEDCKQKADCHIWLLQIKKEHLSASDKHREKNKRTPKTKDSKQRQAKQIGNWHNVLPPIRVEDASHLGWRKLYINYANGEVEHWQIPKVHHQRKEGL